MLDISEAISYPEYWFTEISAELCYNVNEYLKDNNISRKEFAKKAGVSELYVTRILEGEPDHSLSEYVAICLAMDMVPQVKLESKERYLEKLNKIGGGQK